jgi:low affinity Fe/Cu permease
MNGVFRKISVWVSARAGSSAAFTVAILVVLIWAVTGPLFDFSNTWQLVINTGTTIVTFLMVFLVQNTQNRDAKAMQLKLDELLKASKAARDKFIDIENLSDQQISQLASEFNRLSENSEEKRKSGGRVDPRWIATEVQDLIKKVTKLS